MNYRYTGQREEPDFDLYFYGARWYDPMLGRFAQADTIIPGVGNAQAWDRYAYSNNNAVRYTDPSGHRPCDEPFGCFGEDGNPRHSRRSSPASLVSIGGNSSLGCTGIPNWAYWQSSGYSSWEISMLQRIYGSGASSGVVGVESILAFSIHIAVGNPLAVYAPNTNGNSYSGDLQSAFAVGGWYDSANRMVVLNPSYGYKAGVMPDNFGLQLIVHEATHVLQGPIGASTAYGELAAWQAGFQVLAALQYPEPLSDTQKAIVDLPLNHNSANLMVAVNLMEADQGGGYLGGYLLYLTIPGLHFSTWPK